MWNVLVKGKEPEDVVDDLDPTEDGEPSEKKPIVSPIRPSWASAVHNGPAVN